MAQHDFDITVSDANTGLTMRSEWNSALQALASSSQGAGVPSTTYPCQIWADTTSNLLKIRNTDNDAWHIIGSLDTTNFGLLSLSGVHEFTVTQKLKGDGLLWRFKDTNAEWGIRCDNGNVLELCENTNTEVSPTWVVRASINTTNVDINSATADLAQNANTIQGYSPSQTSASGVVVLADNTGKIDSDFIVDGDIQGQSGVIDADSFNGYHISSISYY